MPDRQTDRETHLPVHAVNLVGCHGMRNQLHDTVTVTPPSPSVITQIPHNALPRAGWWTSAWMYRCIPQGCIAITITRPSQGCHVLSVTTWLSTNTHNCVHQYCPQWSVSGQHNYSEPGGWTIHSRPSYIPPLSLALA